MKYINSSELQWLLLSDKCREKVDSKFKMIKFTSNELKQSIPNAVKPESDVTNDVDSLLKAVYA